MREDLDHVAGDNQPVNGYTDAVDALLTEAIEERR